MDTLFSHVSVVTMDERMSVLTDAFVGVTDGKIAYLSKKAPEEKPTQIVDAGGAVLLPGLINCHTHLPLTLLRGLSKKKTPQELAALEQKFDARTVRAASLLGIAECLRFGVTGISEQYGFTDATAEAAAQAGIKANLSMPLLLDTPDDYAFDDDPQWKQVVSLREKWDGFDEGRIRVDCSLQSPVSSCVPLWDAMAEYCINTKLRLQLSLTETEREQAEFEDLCGLSPVQMLDAHRLFDVPALTAHCAFVSPEDAALLAKRKVSAVLCPTQELYSGCKTDVLALVKAGMNVCLGTDAAQNLDLFTQLRAAVLTERKLPAEAALMMATVCGARAQGRQTECGMIKLGLDADLILLDFNQPHLIPCHDLVSALAFGVTGSDVSLTMVRGKILYANGKFPTIDLAAAVKELHDHAVPTVFG